MKTHLGKFVASAALAIAALATLTPAPASAVITSSNITAPANNSLFFFDEANDPTATYAISGTATGTGNVDIRCYYGATATDDNLLTGPALNVPVVAGAFSIPNAVLDDISAYNCRLRAVPAGTEPANPSPFTGPVVATSQRQQYKITSGPNTGKLRDLYVASVLPSGGSDYGSISSCGLDDSWISDSTPTSYYVFYCNDWIPKFGKPTTQAPMTVDGAPAFGADTINSADGNTSTDYFTGFKNLQPFPDFTFPSFDLNPVNRDLTFSESSRFAKCAPDAATFKPTAGSCTSFADAPVKVDRTVVADHGQKQTRISDHWSSTDGHSHLLSLQLRNNQSLQSSTNIGFKFPGQADYAKHVDGDTIGGPFPQVATAYIKDTTVGDGPPGQGAITWSRAPDSVVFAQSTHSDFFANHANLTVPATGTLDLQYAYSTAFTTAEVSSLAHEAEDRFSNPSVAFSSPANGSNTTSTKLTVKGTATDLVGVSSFTLNGASAALGAGGAFSASVKLKPGANTITGLAKDAFGNTGQAQLAVNSLALKHKGKAKVSRSGLVTTGYEFICPPGGATCKLTITGKSKVSSGIARKKNLTVGKSKLTVKPGKTKAVKLKLNRKGKKALKRAGKLKIKLTAKVKIGKTKAGTVRQSFTVRKPRH